MPCVSKYAASNVAALAVGPGGGADGLRHCVVDGDGTQQSFELLELEAWVDESSVEAQPTTYQGWLRKAQSHLPTILLCVLTVGVVYRSEHLFNHAGLVTENVHLTPAWAYAQCLGWLGSATLAAALFVALPAAVVWRCCKAERRVLTMLALVAALPAVWLASWAYIEHVKARMQAEGILSAVVSGLWVAHLWPLAAARDDPGGSAAARLVTAPQTLNLVYVNRANHTKMLSSMKLAHQCAFETMVRERVEVTLWYRGLPLIDDLGLGFVIKQHKFSRDTKLGAWWHEQRVEDQGILGGYDRADIVRLDVIERYGGIYVDNDAIILSRNLTRVGRGLARQNFFGAHLLNNAILKFPAHDPFIERCIDDLIRVWDAYAEGKETWGEERKRGTWGEERKRGDLAQRRWNHVGNCVGPHWLCFAMGSCESLAPSRSPSHHRSCGSRSILTLHALRLFANYLYCGMHADGFLSPALFTRVFFYNWDPALVRDDVLHLPRCDRRLRAIHDTRACV